MPAMRELAPLAVFRPLPRIDRIEAADLPPPYRALLDHARDMTSTLEAFHKGRIELRVLNSSMNHSRYQREVLLMLEHSKMPVEHGAIQIVLDAFPPAGQKLILEGRRPLGAILEACAIDYTSRPSAFLRVESDEAIGRALNLPKGRALFGRCNTLSDGKGRVLAEIVEILPPMEPA